MNISLQLLNKYIKIDDQDPQSLADQITAIGLEVEGLTSLARGTDLVVGYIMECYDHPNSDHLHVCKVEIEPGNIVQIVCGAPNVAAGQKVIVARVGCDLGAGFVIRKGNIRDQESNGMICSLLELGIDARFLNEEQKAGIEVLDTDAPIGAEALSYLGLQDTILDIGLTPNRTDCMAVRSLAYEVGAILHRDLTLPKIVPMEERQSDIAIQVETELCTFFGAKLVKGVVTKESPQWLKSILMASGIKPVNTIVDISNFVMLETGQPIHMYDYDKLQQKQFIIKTGFSCKKQLLDGEEYQIEPQDIIVSTDDSIGCIAGIMGSEDTKIDATTTNIVIEAATFDGAALRHTARRLNLLTDASSHYIKGAIDTSSTKEVLARCANLLIDLADAKEIYESVTTDLNIEPKVLTLTTNRVNRLLGTTITTKQIEDIFTSLKFSYTLQEDTFTIRVPTYRNDITMEADLIEEVARMYGYNNIPSTLPVMHMTKGMRTESQAKRLEMKTILKDLGLHETISYTLTGSKEVDDFNIFHNKETIMLASPLGEERSVTRKSLIPSLLQTIHYNHSHATKDVNIFEISSTYSQGQEIQSLAIACTGKYHALAFKQIHYQADYYLVKGFVETIFKNLGIEESRYKIVRVSHDDKNYHPGRSAYIMIGKNIVGVIGSIHPIMEKKYDVKEVYVVELNLSALLQLKTSRIQFTPIAMYPAVTRDIALVMDREILTYDVIRKIKQASKQLVKEANIFDVYEGEHIAEGKKSVAISLTLQDPKQTLKEETINETMHIILTTLEKEFNAVLRT
jgi:phenylalanyl-tRNA synthetase beta chain